MKTNHNEPSEIMPAKPHTWLADYYTPPGSADGYWRVIDIDTDRASNVIATFDTGDDDADESCAVLLAAAPRLVAVCKKLAARGALIATTGLGDELRRVIADAETVRT